MPIVFDEVTADIAPPPAPAEAPAAGAAPAGASEVDVQRQLRQSLALLQEREARLFTD